MTANPDAMSAEVPCHRCGYDVRAHPEGAICPECGASVAESRRAAAVPLRPHWRDSDPRWRRRILAGAWLLVLVPLVDVLLASGQAARIPVPNILPCQGAVVTLDETYLANLALYPPLVFCTGVVLLFSKERRRRAKLDWTRRWGVICSYVVMFLTAVYHSFITALVLTGIAALCLSMPLKYQPPLEKPFVILSTAYLRHFFPKPITTPILVAFSSITMILACVPLFDALRSTARDRRRATTAAAVLLAPLAGFALVHLAQSARYCVSSGPAPTTDFANYIAYFWPELPAKCLAGAPPNNKVSGPIPLLFLVEAMKWCIILAIALWLTGAQVFAHKNPASGPQSTVNRR